MNPTPLLALAAALLACAAYPRIRAWRRWRKFRRDARLRAFMKSHVFLRRQAD